MKKALKFFAFTLAVLLGISIAGVEYLEWRYNQSLTYAMAQVEQGNWRPHLGYSRLLRQGTDEQVIEYVSKYIDEGDGQIMSNAVQLPTESDQQYLDRVNEGRRIMGFTPTTLEEVKSIRFYRRLYGPRS
jgi:hypothetical protein